MVSSHSIPFHPASSDLPFHSNARRNHDAPKDRLWIELHALPQGHLVLLICGTFGPADDLGHAFGLLEPIFFGEMQWCIGRADRVICCRLLGRHD